MRTKLIYSDGPVKIINDEYDDGIISISLSDKRFVFTGVKLLIGLHYDNEIVREYTEQYISNKKGV